MDAKGELTLDPMCSTCRQVLEATDGVVDMDEVEYQSFEAFCDAISEGCVLCSHAWFLFTRDDMCEGPDENSWRRPTFELCLKLPKERFQKLDISTSGWSDIFWLFPLRDLGRDTNLLPPIEACSSSILTLDLAFAFVRRCLSTHDACGSLGSSNSKWLPTRLVDIGFEGDHQWRLIETAKETIDTAQSYMTLSYRWSLHPQLLLLTSNLESFQFGNPIEQLPLTFRDAVVVARHFGVRYLWIDCLCIIQNSDTDWELEAPMMRNIYANSWCNIAASASRDPDGGLFRERDPKEIRPWTVKSTLSSGSMEKHFMLPCGYWGTQLMHGGLHERGWVFQECLLAPRVLYFGKSQVLWECSETHGCEAFPEGIPDFEPSKLAMSKALKENEEVSQDGISGPSASIAEWLSLAGEFSRCELTYPEDRLYAFAGIAKLFQETTGYHYFAGVWKEGLLYQLAWYVQCPVPRVSKRYRAPSWSWASIDGEARFTSSTSKTTQFFARIIDVRVTTKNPQSMVDVLDGFIKLSCPLFTASYSRASKMEPLCLEIRQRNARFLLRPTWNPDTKDEQSLIGEGTIDFLFFSQAYNYVASCDIECIVVERTTADGLFKRIGTFRLHGKDIGDVEDILASSKMEHKIITLI